MKNYKGASLVSLAVLIVLALGAYAGFVVHREGLHSMLHSRLVGHTPPCCRREVASLLPVDIGGDHDLFVDAVRIFVNEYSIRSPSAGSSAYDTGGVIRSLLEARRGTGEPPHLLCSSRANAMSGILEAFGIKARQVHIFSQSDGSHTFIEVQNPSTGMWVAHDPDYNMIWMSRRGERRLGLGELVTAPMEEIIPCRVPGDCNWNLAEHLRVFLGAGVYFNFDGRPHALVNRKRFNPATLLTYTTPPRTLQEYISDLWELDYGPPVVSIISGTI